MSDYEYLCQIEELFLLKGDTPFDAEFNPLIRSLSFTGRSLDGDDHGTLKLAWSRFLENAYGHDTSWEWPCNDGIAQWYLTNKMVEHAIAVYEHLYAQIRRGETLDCTSNYQEWLSQLFELCAIRGLTTRARHVAELIGDYYNDGLVGPDTYAEVLAVQGSLRYQEMGELIHSDRESAEGRLRSEERSGLIEKLHAATKSHMIDAEVWSHPRLRHIEPGIAPNRFALAIESEFHYKVFEPHRIVLTPALNSPNHKAPRSGQCCNLGQIQMLITLSNHNPLVKAVFSKLSGHPGLTDVPEALDVLGKVRLHRNDLAHAGSGGHYSNDRCNEFLRLVRETRWIFRFLSAIQSR